MQKMRMQYILGLVLAVMWLTGCKGQEAIIEGDCVEYLKEDCYCTLQYDPVCGCNQKTYGNACIAQCSGITDFVPGECP